MKPIIKNSLFFIAVIFSFQVVAQNFSGIITNKDYEVIENAQVVLQYPNAEFENDTVYSDALGYYNVGTAVGIEDLPNANSEISYQINNNILYISIQCSNEINRKYTNGKLYSLQGKLIAECLLITSSKNTIVGQFNVQNLHNTICIFTDGFHSVKIPIIKDNRLRQGVVEQSRNTQATLVLRSLSSYSKAELVEARLAQCHTDFDKLNLQKYRNSRSLSLSNNRSLSLSKADLQYGNTPSTSSGSKTKNENYHLIINHPNYQSIDSTLQNINNTQGYTIDF